MEITRISADHFVKPGVPSYGDVLAMTSDAETKQSCHSANSNLLQSWSLGP